MKRLFLGTTGLLAMVAAATAADLPARTYGKAPAMVAAVYDWSGFYLGANGGYASARKCWDLTNDGFAPVNPAIAGVSQCDRRDRRRSFGYRWQSASWVFGIEAQGNWADLKGSHVTAILAAPLAGGTRSSRIDALGLFTGQIGYAWANTLLYVKGGAAVTRDKYDSTTPGFVPNSGRETRWGGVVGIGLEYGLTPTWSLAFEYDHLFHGHARRQLLHGSRRIRRLRPDSSGRRHDHRPGSTTGSAVRSSRNTRRALRARTHGAT